MTASPARIISFAFLVIILSTSILPGGQFARHAAAQTVSEKSDVRKATSKRDIRRLQRLLKLLSVKNPNRFASADPGVIDGTLGLGTITAIKSFQRTIGVRENPTITPALFAQILTAQAELPMPSQIAAPIDKAAGKGDCAPGADPSACRSRVTGTAAKAIPGDAGITARTGTRQVRYAQLGSLKDRTRVDEEWTRLLQMNPELLKGYKPVIETANLDQRGTYHRILIGPFNGFQAAQSFCTKLRIGGQGCLVKKKRNMVVSGTGAKRDPARMATADPDSRPKPRSAPAPAPVIATPLAPSSDTNPKPQETLRPVPGDDVVRIWPPEAPAVKSPGAAVPPPENTTDGPATPRAGDASASPVVPAPTPKVDVKAPVTQPSGDRNVADAAPTIDKVITADKAAPRTATPATALVQWLGRLNQNAIQSSYFAPVIAAVAGTCFGFFVLVVWQRRRRNLVFGAIQGDPWLDAQEREFVHHDNEPTAEDILGELRMQFESPELVECRRVRDSFLHGLTNAETSWTETAASMEKSMLVNRRLNQMIATEPVAYKSIFLNWIFLNHVAAALERTGYTLKRLDPRIQREFHLLGSFFKIHLLELEARHHVRDRLPNVFATLHEHES